MAHANFGSCEQFSDDALMHRLFELAGQPGDHAEEMAALDAAIQARMLATYGANEPGTAPRVRIAA